MEDLEGNISENIITEKTENLKKLCGFYLRENTMNVIGENTSDLNFLQQKDKCHLKNSYFFIKNKENNENKEGDSNDKLYYPNNIDLVVFNPFTENFCKFSLSGLIKEIADLYEKYGVLYNPEILKINYLFDFNYNYDCFGNLFLFGGFFEEKSNEKEKGFHNLKGNTMIYKINPFKKETDISCMMFSIQKCYFVI